MHSPFDNPAAKRALARHRLTQQTRIILQAIFLGLLSIALMVADQRSTFLTPARNILQTGLYPLQLALHLPVEGVTSLQKHWVNKTELQSQNDQLKQQQVLLNVQLQKMASLEAENRRLRMLLKSSVDIEQSTLIAEVLSVGSDSARHVIVLNRGTAEQVAVGQPVLDQQGIIGQIMNSNPLSSTAILITDPTHALPVQINRNGLRTLVVGTGQFNQLEVIHVQNKEDVQIGDLLVTSGLDGRFPKGYPVAVITQVDFDPARPFARVFARPTAKVDRIREVLILNTPPAIVEEE